jgi:hypothetical protein
MADDDTAANTDDTTSVRGSDSRRKNPLLVETNR